MIPEGLGRLGRLRLASRSPQRRAILAKEKDRRSLTDQRDQQQQQREAAEERPRPERQVTTLSPVDAVWGASSGTNT